MNNTLNFTRHCEARLAYRLSSLVTRQEVAKKLQTVSLPTGRSYVEIKSIKYVEIADESVKPDGIARGDSIVAVIDNSGYTQVTTIILRKSWSKSTTYANIIH